MRNEQKLRGRSRLWVALLTALAAGAAVLPPRPASAAKPMQFYIGSQTGANCGGCCSTGYCCTGGVSCEPT
ncbi:hypothetical protein [Longimicrobium terrae]|uniref:Uncharacterized protein n=1 Tax=Longimicrobium terrae TaxID=1639882 RepID=A0A841GIG8_9BACT|nr:hypothetical protein [Longimicrobium terrae]MBB4634679.1 hypothetical protein [Longimicrobium terrae]MBB6068431.1 hypothetical protein [Longimicrobium terrae]NNC32712.1 hypothetical protein [Longimicrobium terrae]